MFNGALTPNRSVAFADVSFDDVKAIKSAFGTTVNDVVLAGCCAALRSWLGVHGGLPDRPLVATVPVSVRHEGDLAGNRVSVIRVHLPIHSDDPVERLIAINEETSRRKRHHGKSGGGDILKNFADLVTNITVPWIATHFIGFYSSRHLADRVPPLWNLIISNVAGPPVPLYTAGTRLTHLFPLGPVQQGSGPQHHGDERGRPSLFRRAGLRRARPRRAGHRHRFRSGDRAAQRAHRVALGFADAEARFEAITRTAAKSDSSRARAH